MTSFKDLQARRLSLERRTRQDKKAFKKFVPISLQKINNVHQSMERNGIYISGTKTDRKERAIQRLHEKIIQKG